MRARRSLALAVAIALGAGACSGGGDSSGAAATPTAAPAPEATRPSDPAPTTTAPATTAPVPTTTSTLPTPEFDPGAQMVMFAPVPPRPADKPDWPTPDGSADFYDLFEHPERWEDTLAELDVFKLHSWMVRHYLTDEDLVLIDEVLRQRGVPLMIEAEPLEPPDPAECMHSESYEGPYEIENLQRLRDLGVEVAAVAIEQPLHFGHLWTDPNACQYPLDRIFDELLAWRAEVHRSYPDAAFGSIEGVWDITTAEDYERWLDGWEAASGEPFAFQHIDVNWQLADWIDTALAIEGVADARDVPFGILFNGGLGTDNDEWILETMRRAAEYEQAGGTPDHVMFQSWVDQPDFVLPDDEISGFTHLIRRSGHGPSALDVALDGTSLSGTLDVASRVGTGVVPVNVTAEPLAGGRQTMTLEGTVPGGATEAFVVMRFNVEDATPNEIATDLIDVSVTQSGGPNLVPNGDFSNGLEGWGAYGSETGRTFAGSVDGDAAMSVRATPDEEILVDGVVRFPIVADEPLTLTVDARLGTTGPGGAVAVIFAGPSEEFARLTLPLELDPTEVASTFTDVDGTFTVDVGAIGAGEHRLTVDSPGDVRTWPATATITATIPEPS